MKIIIESLEEYNALNTLSELLNYRPSYDPTNPHPSVFKEGAVLMYLSEEEVKGIHKISKLIGRANPEFLKDLGNIDTRNTNGLSEFIKTYMLKDENYKTSGFVIVNDNLVDNPSDANIPTGTMTIRLTSGIVFHLIYDASKFIVLSSTGIVLGNLKHGVENIFNMTDRYALGTKLFKRMSLDDAIPPEYFV